MPSLQNFGIPTGDSFTRGGILMPKVKNRFRVFVANFGIPGSEVAFTQQVITAARPNVAFAPTEVHSYNSIAYYAGKAAWETVEVTLRDDVTNAISRLVGAQMQRQMNFFEQTVKLASGDYKFDMAVETLDGGGIAPDDAVILEQWIYEGCFLSAINYEAFDYASADAMTISLTVRFDNATQSGGLMPNPPFFNITTSNV
jgi:hypothetical protein